MPEDQSTNASVESFHHNPHPDYAAAMKTRALSFRYPVLCIASSMVALSCAQTGGGRGFLASRSSIDVADAPTCASAVVDNNDCRPGNFGGTDWEKRPSFPPFSVSDGAVRSGPSNIVAEVRRHYLGSPYYEGDVHAYCKSGIDTDQIPADNTSVQEFELARVIDDRAVKPMTAEVQEALESRIGRDSASLTLRFEERLKEEVTDRVKARMLWFVTRYPGGVRDMTHNERLRKCLQEQRDNDAPLVTGVAGYVVLNNQIDTAIASADIVERALDLALRGRDDVLLDPEFKHHLGMEWHERVEKVASIKLPRNDVTAVAWPMWVQFE